MAGTAAPVFASAEDLVLTRHVCLRFVNVTVGREVAAFASVSVSAGNEETSITHNFDTALTEQLAGGFRSRCTPDQGHGATDTADLVIV